MKVIPKVKLNISIEEKGGAGSGNFGHAGRPGKVGGSAPSGMGGSGRSLGGSLSHIKPYSGIKETDRIEIILRDDAIKVLGANPGVMAGVDYILNDSSKNKIIIEGGESGWRRGSAEARQAVLQRLNDAGISFDYALFD